MADDQKAHPNYAEAKRRVEALKGFYIHAFVYICVISALAGINMISRGDWWVHWPMLGWGLGVLGHALAVCGPMQRVGQDWQTRKIDDELRRM
jgi:hypothetical protein